MHHPVTAKEMLTLSTHLGQQVCTSKSKQYWVHFFSLAHIRCRTYTKTIGLPELLNFQYCSTDSWKVCSVCWLSVHQTCFPWTVSGSQNQVNNIIIKSCALGKALLLDVLHVAKKDKQKKNPQWFSLNFFWTFYWTICTSSQQPCLQIAKASRGEQGFDHLKILSVLQLIW